MRFEKLRTKSVHVSRCRLFRGASCVPHHRRCHDAMAMFTVHSHTCKLSGLRERERVVELLEQYALACAARMHDKRKRQSHTDIERRKLNAKLFVIRWDGKIAPHAEHWVCTEWYMEITTHTNYAIMPKTKSTTLPHTEVKEEEEEVLKKRAIFVP